MSEPARTPQDRAASAALIAVDWGTSAVRAYWLDSRGAVVRTTSAPLGVQKVAAGAFADALASLLGAADGGEDAPMIACGMIGSRQGWIEVPYRDCPADVDSLAAGLAHVPGTPLAIVPGLVCREASGVPDVMRGEETQVLGAVDAAPAHDAGRTGPPRGTAGATRVFVLPGTHSKWVLTRGSRIESFTTFMTGELYAVLGEYSILGRLAIPGGNRSAFERGVRHSLSTDASLSHDLFSARTLALAGELAPDAVGDYLSGLLVGAEIASGRRWLERQRVGGDSVRLIGEATLCERYAHALAFAGVEATIGPADAAARGLWRIARCAARTEA